MAKSPGRAATAPEKASLYDTIAPLMRVLYEEIGILSKKKPDATLNAGKVKLINRLLLDMKEMLDDEPANKYLDMLDDENLPQYSDVVLILSQFSAAMSAFHKKYYNSRSFEGPTGWVTK